MLVKEDDNTEADGTDMGILFVVLHSPLYVCKSTIDWSQTRRTSIVVVEVMQRVPCSIEAKHPYLIWGTYSATCTSHPTNSQHLIEVNNPMTSFYSVIPIHGIY